MRVGTVGLTRGAALARSAWGGVLLWDTTGVLSAFGDQPATGAVVTARVLGGRQLAQGALTILAPNPAVVAVGVAADALHALTAVALAVLSPRWRNVALTDAVVAATLAATGYWLIGRDHRRR